MPWYDALERALKPVEGYTTLLLVALAIITLLIAWKGDAVAKTAWFIYLVSP